MDEPSRILVIDDEEAARYGMVRALSSQGYEIAEASDGAAALGVLEEFRPDVVVSDVNMPELDGISLVRRLRDVPDAPLVILVTAYGNEERVLEALRAGAYDFVAKPFDVGQLRVVVRNAAERQQLARLNRRFQNAILQAERLATLGRLVAGVAHEINNPLGALLSAVDTLERVVKRIASPGTDAAFIAMADNAAKGARDAGARLSRVVRNLKRFARIDEPETGQTRLAESLDDTLSLLERELEGVLVERSVDEQVRVPGTIGEWNDVLLNLLLNARDAIQSRGKDGRIAIRIAAQDGTAVIEIQDNGAGIPESELEHIFDPGFTTKGVRVGTGLGLPICYRAVQAHLGTIDVESREGEGTRFVIRVPAATGS